MMGWPKGLKRKPRLDPDMIPIAPPRPRDDGGLPINAGSKPSDDGFQVGKWYLYSGTPGILTDTAGRVLKWSVIKFEVIKMTNGIVAVRFEDGSFEAIVDPDFTKFKAVQAPRY